MTPTRRTRCSRPRALRSTTGLVATLLVAVGASCSCTVTDSAARRPPGSGSTDARAIVAVRSDPGRSVYCRTVAGRAPVPPAKAGSAGYEQFWEARRAFEFRAVWTAPSAIRADWRTVSTFTTDLATPVVAAAGYRPGSAPPAGVDVVDARRRIDAYDRGVCSPGDDATVGN